MYSCDIFRTYRAFLAVVRDSRVDIERRYTLVFLSDLREQRREVYSRLPEVYFDGIPQVDLG